MQKVKYFIFLLAIITIGGCKLGPDFRSPAYEGPGSFRFDTTTVSRQVNLRWWELFDDPVLDTLIKTAISENKDVKRAAAGIEAARANMGYTKSGQFPSFQYAAGVSASGMKSNISSGFNVYPELTWEIGFWGKYRRLNEAAQAGFLASEFAKRTIQLSLVSAVASTYFAILADMEQLAITKETLASRDSALLIMNDKYEGGMISLMDYNQAKIQRDIAAAIIPAYKRNIAINENSLSILLGQMPQAVKIGKPFNEHSYHLDIPSGIPSEIIVRRPDIKRAEAVWQAQNAQIGVAEALRWPSLNLTGFAGVASSELLSLNAIGLTWSASSTLFGPLFQFGKNKRRVEMAVQNAKMAMLDYEKTVQQAFKEVEDALVSIQTFKDELAVQESRAKTAVESEKLSYIRYNEGSTTYLEVLEQQRASLSARLDLTKARFNLLNSYILLYKALGGGWLSPEEESSFLQNVKSTR